MNIIKNPYFQIHLCVILWGFTAILGKLITLAALPLVFIRMMIVAIVLSCFPIVWRGLKAFKIFDLLVIGMIGCVVAVHWLLFYWSIKLSNASVATTCIALGAVFVAIIEPIVTQRPFRLMELSLGILTIPGVVLVVGGLPSGMLLGFAVGVGSAFFVAIFGSLNKRFTPHLNSLSVTFIELLCGGVFLLFISLISPNLPSVLVIPSQADWLWLLILAIACTLLPFSISLFAIKKVSAFSLQLSVNLEPIYAILLAIPFFGEHKDLSISFYLGVLLILSAVAGQPIWEKLTTKSATLSK